MDMTIYVVILMLVTVGSYEGLPVGKRLGKRSLTIGSGEENEGIVESFGGNPFTDVREMEPQFNLVETEDKGVKLGKGTENKDITPRQRLLLKELLASFSSGKRFWQNNNALDSNNKRFQMGNRSFFGKLNYRYKKRGGESVMAVPESKASARAAFMQARRRMGPEFNPTGW